MFTLLLRCCNHIKNLFQLKFTYFISPLADLEGVLEVIPLFGFVTTVDVAIAPSYGSRQVFDFMEPSQPF